MAVNTVSNTSQSTAAPVSRDVVARPVAEDKSIVDRFTDTVSFDNIKHVAGDVVDAGDDLLDKSVKELKAVVGGFLGWVGLSMLSEMNRQEEKTRERRKANEAELAMEDAHRAANAAKSRNESQARDNAA